MKKVSSQPMKNLGVPACSCLETQKINGEFTLAGAIGVGHLSKTLLPPQVRHLSGNSQVSGCVHRMGTWASATLRTENPNCLFPPFYLLWNLTTCSPFSSHIQKAHDIAIQDISVAEQTSKEGYLVIS